MKPLSELRNNLPFNPQEQSSSIRYLMLEKIDWNIWLPTFGCNLQRDYVWDNHQKSEIIHSILLGRHIPHCAIINIIDPDNANEGINQIIDGKQRLSSIFSYVNNEFSINLDGSNYFFYDLPIEYQRGIVNYHVRYYVVNEESSKKINDLEKYQWFKFLNFAGTPQDKYHLDFLDYNSIK